jgi:hypothetical protein
MDGLGASSAKQVDKTFVKIPTFITDEQRLIGTVINSMTLAGMFSLFGIVANSINIIIFYKQGLNTTINISFFTLAISDLCGLLVQVWYSICINPLWETSGIPLLFTDVVYFTAGVPREVLSRITCLITVYITAERCLCIAFPLKIKQMITTRRTTITIITIYIVTFSSALPLYCTSSLDWKFVPKLNTSLIGLISTTNDESAESSIFIIHALAEVISFLAVILLTSILIRKLRQKSKFRKESSNLNQETAEEMTARDRRTVTMIVLIATVLIICYTPAVILCVLTFYESEFKVVGRNVNEFQMFWSFAFLFEAINSSVNIFLYYRMSSKYRQTFRELFSRCGFVASTDLP